MAEKTDLWLPPTLKQNRFPSKVKQVAQAAYKFTGLPGKSLWDILQLLGVLAIPLVVVLASNSFSNAQNLTNLHVSEQQHQTDIQIASDQQHETTLQAYMNTISSLMLNNKPLQSQPGDAVREVARIQTLDSLLRLDPARKVILLQFLYDANLIGNATDLFPITSTIKVRIFPAIISMYDANLTNTNLSGVFLMGANLSLANLTDADLIGTFFSSANLSGANLSGANLIRAILFDAFLSNANLSGANLSDAFLINADLTQANLSGANLTGANLSGANLSGANLTDTNLSGVNLSKTTMPNGSIHP